MRAPGTQHMWLMRPRPQPDELLSSWLHRLAQLNGMLDHTFCSFMWPERPIWNRDVDRSTDPELLNELSNWTGVNSHDIWRLSLEAYSGVIAPTVHAKGHCSWILPLGIYHRVRRLPGQLYCPACLKQEPPHMRRAWRLACSLACEEHACQLLDCCAWCEAPIMFHRMNVLHPRHLGCSSCDGNLFSARAPAASDQEMAAQDIIGRALKGERIVVGEHQVESLDFLRGMRTLVGATPTGSRPGLANGMTGIDPVLLARLPRNEAMFETWPFERRRDVLLRLMDLLPGWPDSLVELMHRGGVLPSRVRWGLARDLPKWILEPVVKVEEQMPYKPARPRVEAMRR